MCSLLLKVHYFVFLFVVFIIIVTVRPLLVCLCIFVRFVYDSLVPIYLERDVLLLSACVILYWMTFFVFVSFPFGALDRMSIISVPDHCRFIYLVLLVRPLVCLSSVFKLHYMSRDMTNHIFGSFRPGQTQTGLRSHRS